MTMAKSYPDIGTWKFLHFNKGYKHNVATEIKHIAIS